MPRNGSGTYTRPQSDYVPGTTILATSVNSDLNDMASALTASLARDGQTTPTANIPLGGFRITGLGNATAATDAATLGQVDGRAEIDLASASTTNIGAQQSDNVRITGTTTITSFGTIASGVTRQLRFAAALTLTHNATSLILPGGANIITAAGDTATAVSLGSGNWVVTDFMPASGWRGSSVVLAEAIASGSATLDITTGLDNTYDRYELELVDLKPATNDVQAALRIGTGAGPTWQTGASAYASSILGIGSGSTALLGNTAGGFIPLSQAPGGGNGVISLAGYPGLRGLIRFYNPESTDRWNCNLSVEHFTGSGALVSLTGGGLYGAASAITGLRFYFSTGNISSGSIRLLGYRK
jgi:hypothetical protein